jgi:hypothetical protein
MIKQVSDTDIRAEVRSHLVRHRIDLQRAQFRVHNATVRVSGEIFHLGGQEQPVTLGLIESLERDIAGTSGVRHTFFELKNWRRLDTGQWESVQGENGSRGRSMKSIPLTELLDVMPRRRAA